MPTTASWSFRGALALLVAVAAGCGGDLVLPEGPSEAAVPDTVRAVSPQNQPGRRKRELEEPLVVQVVDRLGSPVADVRVRWRVTAGEGEVSAPEVETGADGQASVRWTLGGEAGVQKVEASVSGGVHGSPVVFTAIVLF